MYFQVFPLVVLELYIRDDNLLVLPAIFRTVGSTAAKAANPPDLNTAKYRKNRASANKFISS